MDGFGVAVNKVQEINIKNAAEIFSKGNKEQIMHLFKVYNNLAAKGGAPLLTPAELQEILAHRGFKGYGGFGDWWDTALKVGNGLANIAGAVGPTIIQKYQIDKMPSVVPATPPAVAAAGAPGPAITGRTDWTTYAMYGGGILLVGGVLYFMLGKKKKA